MSVSSSDDEEQYRLPALPPVEDDEPETLDEVKERLKMVAEELKRPGLKYDEREDLLVYEDDLKDKLFVLTPAMPYREWKKELNRLWELRLKTSPSKQPKELYALKKQIEAHEAIKHYAIRSGEHEGRRLSSISPPPELAEPNILERTLQDIAALKKNPPKKFVFHKPQTEDEMSSDDEAPPGIAASLVHSFHMSHPPVKKSVQQLLERK